MLILKILNPTTKVCIPVFSFFSGEIKTLMVQVWDTDTDAAATVAASLVTKTLTLSSSGSTDISITNTDVTQNATPSIFSVTLTAAQTALMQTGNVKFAWTVGTSPNDTKYQAVGQLKIKKQISAI